MVQICRTCLLILTEDTSFVDLSDNTAASLEIRSKLSYCLPEMNIELVSETVLCTSCLDILDFIYKFKKQCLEIEHGICKYIDTKIAEDSGCNTYSITDVYNPNAIEKKENIDIKSETPNTDQVLSSEEEEEELIVTPQIENIFEAYKDAEDVLIGDQHNCPNCNFKTDNYLHLRKHMKVHGIKMHFECKYCNYRSLNKHNFVTHARVHTGEKPFQCTFCNANFALKSTLVQHMNIHTKAKLHSCTVCGFQTVHRRALGDHMKRHTGEKPHACNMCMFRTARKRYLRMHTEKRHNNNI